MNWKSVVDTLSDHPYRTDFVVSRYDVVHPSRVHGFERSSGFPKGQFTDWRYTFPNCLDLHVREFSDRYEVHLDEVAPSCDVVEHVRVDAPEVYAAMGAGFGAALGAASGKGLGGSLFGAALGLGVAALMTAAPARRLWRA